MAQRLLFFASPLLLIVACTFRLRHWFLDLHARPILVTRAGIFMRFRELS